MVAQSYMMDAEKTAAHFDLPVWKVQAALHYYEAFPQARSQTFDTLKRKLPQLECQTVAIS